MYKNIGVKIKFLAIGIAIFMSVIEFLLGISIIADAAYNEQIALGLIYMFVGPPLTWISSWILYGFGELIDKATAIEKNTRKDDTAPTAQPQAVTPDIVKSTINRNY